MMRRWAKSGRWWHGHPWLCRPPGDQPSPGLRAARGMVLMAVLVLAVGGGCDRGGTDVHERFADEVDTLNLVWGHARGSARWPYPVGRSFENHLLFDCLIVPDPELTGYRPRVAREWRMSVDGREWTFLLREGVRWHDGRTLTAADVVASFHAFLGCLRTPGREVALLGGLAGLEEYRAGDADGIRGIEAVDDLTVRFHLDHPSPTFLEGVARFPLLPAHRILRDTSAALFHQSAFWQAPVGCGPFRFVRREAGDFDELAAFSRYFDGRPAIGRVLIRYRDPVLAAAAGQLDFTVVRDPRSAETLTMWGEVELEPTASLQKRELWLNTTRSPLDDLRIRQAIAHAIDRAAIARQLIGGRAVPWHSAMTPSRWANRDLSPVEYDPARARRLLAAAGGIGRKLDFVYYHADALSQDIVVAIQAYLREAGIDVAPRLIARDVATIINVQRDFDVAFGAANGTDGRFLEWFGSGGRNPTGYQNPALDPWLISAAREMDPGRRKAAYDRVQEVLRRDLPVVPLFVDDFYFARSPRLVMPVKFLSKWFPVDGRVHEWRLVAGGE